MDLTDLVAKYDGLKKKQRDLNRLQEGLNQEAADLVPLVLEHFNRYVKNTINVSLPEGYSLMNAEKAVYKNGYFELTTGPMRTPSGLTLRPMKYGERVSQLRQSYVENTPWVCAVKLGFEIGK